MLPKRKAITISPSGNNKKPKTNSQDSPPTNVTVVQSQFTAPQQKHTFSSTPWSYWNEWNHVYSMLFSTLPHVQHIGIMRVAAWRCRGTLPVAIESTASLVEATLVDKKSKPDFSNHTNNLEASTSVDAVKLLYACSIARFVSGILDAKQIAYHPIPLTQLALENGMPLFLVDVRHQACHSAALPSMPILRLAADVGLQWLKTVYWERQTNALASLRSHILGILMKYKNLMSILVRDNMTNNEGHFAPDLSQDSSVARIMEVKQCIEEITSIANPNLVQEVLVPLLVSSDFSDHLNGADSGQRHYFLLPPGKYAGFVVPQELVLTWHIALRKFSHQWDHFKVDLLLSLVNQIVDSVRGAIDLEKDSSEYQMNILRTAWIGYILRHFYSIANLVALSSNLTTTNNGETNDNYNNSKAKVMSAETAPLISIANICLKNMNVWTKHILAQICNNNIMNTTQPPGAIATSTPTTATTTAATTTAAAAAAATTTAAAATAAAATAAATTAAATAAATATTPVGVWAQLKELSDLKYFADATRFGRHYCQDAMIHAFPAGNIDHKDSDSLMKLVDINEIEKLLSQTHSTTEVLKDKELVWTLNSQYPISTPIGILPNGEFPNLELPTSLDQFQKARFLMTTKEVSTRATTTNNTNISNESGTTSENTNIPWFTEDQPGNLQPKEAATIQEITEDNEISVIELQSNQTDSVNNLFLLYTELFI